MLVTVAALLGGCASKPSATEWAGRVCAAVAPWRTSIAALIADAQKAVSTATSPAQARTELLTLLGGGERASESARQAVLAAGIPDVPDGERVAARFAGSLEVARDAYAHAKADLERAGTDDAKGFYDAVVQIMSQLGTEYAHTSLTVDQLDSPELRAAFDGVAQCR